MTLISPWRSCKILLTKYESEGGVEGQKVMESWNWIMEKGLEGIDRQKVNAVVVP